MTKERTAPQSPEDMAKAAQEAAVKAAMEQAQSMFGSIPGFQMPEGMQEQIMTQMTAGIPNMEEIQAQQEAMLKAAGISVAMGNSYGDIEKDCTYQTSAVDKDGICNALEHFKLI